MAFALIDELSARASKLVELSPGEKHYYTLHRLTAMVTQTQYQQHRPQQRARQEEKADQEEKGQEEKSQKEKASHGAVESKGEAVVRSVS